MGIYEERLKNLKDALAFRKPDRIPWASNVYNWVAVNSPYTLMDLLQDSAKVTESFCKLQEDYDFDTLFFTSLLTNYIEITAPLGGAAGHVIDNEKNSVQVKDISHLEYEELGQFAENPTQYAWTKLFARKFPEVLQGDTIGKIKESMQKMIEFTSVAAGETARRLKGDYHAVPFAPAGIGTSPLLPADELLNNYRGLRNTSRDMRKNPDYFEDVMNKLAQSMLEPTRQAILNSADGTDPTTFVDANTAMVCQTVMSRSQFDRFTWPHLKKILDAISSKGKTIFIYAEGSSRHILDHYQDYPKGSILLYDETDDIFELRKQLPNVALFGGMPCTLLGKGTKEECENYAKHLIDELGRDGGFILSQDKMVSFASDCKAENLKAVSEVAHTYGVN